MSLKTEWKTYGKNAEHTAFTAWLESAASTLPTVVLLQEAWGVDEHIEDVAMRFAKAGYLAVAPDLFAEGGNRPAYFTRPRLQALKKFVADLPPAVFSDPKAREEPLSKLPEPQRSEIAESFTKLFDSALGKTDQYLAMLLDTTRYLRAEHPLAKGVKIAAVGFCLGGGLAAQLACADPHLAAAVVFYGRSPAAEQVAKLTCPILGLYGELDPRVNAGIADFAVAAEKHHKRFEQHIYKGAKHAFFNDTRASFDAAASRDAFARTLEMLRVEMS